MKTHDKTHISSNAFFLMLLLSIQIVGSENRVCCYYSIKNRMPYTVDNVEFLYDNITPLSEGNQSLIAPGETRTWHWYVDYCTSFIGNDCIENDQEAIILVRVQWHDQDGTAHEKVTEPLTGGYKGNWNWVIESDGTVVSIP